MSDYAFDGTTTLRYVVREIDANGLLSIDDMARGYEHPNPGDYERIKANEGVDNEYQAKIWFVRRAIDMLGHQVERVEGDVPRYRLTVAVEEVEYNGEKVSLLQEDKTIWPGGSQPYSDLTKNNFIDNIRYNEEHDDTELIESMRDLGWIPVCPALIDERGIVLIGHRRIAVAEKLGIEKRIQQITIGNGPEADALRLKYAIASNIGGKPLKASSRKRLAIYLYGEKDWKIAEIAKALRVSIYTISHDIPESVKIASIESRVLGTKNPSNDRTDTSEHPNNIGRRSASPVIQSHLIDEFLKVLEGNSNGMTIANISEVLGLSEGRTATRRRALFDMGFVEAINKPANPSKAVVWGLSKAGKARLQKGKTTTTPESTTAPEETTTPAPEPVHEHTFNTVTIQICECGEVLNIPTGWTMKKGGS